MNYRTAGLAALLSALAIGACQSYTVQQPQQLQPTTAMDGRWASSDGVFIATFERGNFTSRFIQTNEVLAQGTYTVAGDSVSLRWLSVQAQQQRSAACTFISADTVSCQQQGGGSFNLTRSA